MCEYIVDEIIRDGQALPSIGLYESGVGIDQGAFQMNEAYNLGVQYYRARNQRRARFSDGSTNPVNPYPDNTPEHDWFWEGYEAASQGFAQ